MEQFVKTHFVKKLLSISRSCYFSYYFYESVYIAEDLPSYKTVHDLMHFLEHENQMESFFQIRYYAYYQKLVLYYMQRLVLMGVLPKACFYDKFMKDKIWEPDIGDIFDLMSVSNEEDDEDDLQSFTGQMQFIETIYDCFGWKMTQLFFMDEEIEDLEKSFSEIETILPEFKTEQYKSEKSDILDQLSRWRGGSGVVILIFTTNLVIGKNECEILFEGLVPYSYLLVLSEGKVIILVPYLLEWNYGVEFYMGPYLINMYYVILAIYFFINKPILGLPQVEELDLSSV